MKKMRLIFTTAALCTAAAGVFATAQRRLDTVYYSWSTSGVFCVIPASDPGCAGSDTQCSFKGTYYSIRVDGGQCEEAIMSFREEE